MKADFESYHKVWHEINGAKPAPKPLSGGFTFVDENADRAEAEAMKWLSGNYKTVIKHYEMTSAKFGSQKGYESYSQVSTLIAKQGIDSAAADFARLMPWGTPDQVLEKLAKIRDTIDAKGFMITFSYAGMPYDEAGTKYEVFRQPRAARSVKKWKTEPLQEPETLTIPSHAVA